MAGRRKAPTTSRKNLVVVGADLSQHVIDALIAEHGLADVVKVVTYAEAGTLDVTQYDWIYRLMADGMNGTSYNEVAEFLTNVERVGRTNRLIRVWG